MNGWTVVTDVVIPLCAAVIGGGLTLFGVWLTMRGQNKKDEAKRKAEVRPWIFSCEEHIPENKKIYSVVPDTGCSCSFPIAGNIKNTENGILILDCVKSKYCHYLPNGDSVVDKNTSIELLIYPADKKENLEEVYLYIRDVYGNRYRYKIAVNGPRFTLGESEDVQANGL